MALSTAQSYVPFSSFKESIHTMKIMADKQDPVE